MTQRESATETRLTRAVRLAGALTYKLAPTTTGLPDRLVVWPGGRVDFVELKDEAGEISPIQARRILALEERRANVYVLFGDAEVDAYLRSAPVPAR